MPFRHSACEHLRREPMVTTAHPDRIVALCAAPLIPTLLRFALTNWHSIAVLVQFSGKLRTSSVHCGATEAAAAAAAAAALPPLLAVPAWQGGWAGPTCLFRQCAPYLHVPLAQNAQTFPGPTCLFRQRAPYLHVPLAQNAQTFPPLPPCLLRLRGWVPASSLAPCLLGGDCRLYDG